MPAPAHTPIDLATDALAVLQPIPDTTSADRYPDIYAPGVQATVEERLSQIIYELNRASRFIRSIKPAEIETLIGGVNDEINGFRVFRGAEQPATQTARFGDIWLSPGDEGVRVPRVFNGVGFVEDLYAVEAILMPIIARLQALESEQAEVFQDAIDELKAEVSGTATSAGDTLGKLEELINTLAAAKAPLSSPALTNTPTAPTAAPGTNTTQIATTAFVQFAAAAVASASVPLSQKGVANGVATLDGGGRVPSGQLPSFVDDIIEAANFAALPGTGEAGKIYVTLNDDKQFRWSGSAYSEIIGSPGSTDAVPEGATNKYFTEARARAAITGTSDVPGLTNALDARNLRALNYAALTSIVSPSNNLLATTLGRTVPGDAPSADWYFDAAATDTPNGGTILQPDAGGTGRWKMIWKGTLSAAHFGSDGTAIAAAMAVSKSVRVHEGTWVFASNTTLPAGRKLRLDPGALLSVNTGVTLTLRCELIDAPVERLFTGAGTVVGLRTVRPEFFGAARDDATDDIVAFEKATACLQGSLSTVGARPTFIMSAGRYVLSRSWVVSVSSTFGPEIYGAGPLLGGTTLVAKTGFNHAAGGLLAIEGQTGSITQLADYIIRDFQIGAIDVGVGLGLSFNRVQTNLISHIGKSKVENINVSNFQYNLWAARLSRVDFDRCSFWNKDIASGFNVNAYLIDGVSGASAFAGEITFTNCDFVQVSTNASGFNVILASLVAGGALAAVRLERCTFYKAATMLRLEMASGGGLGDIWVTDCQFDGPQTKAIDIAQLGASSSTAMSNIHIKGNYFTANAGTMITMLAAKAGGINSVIVTDNYSAGAQAAVNMQNVNGAVVTANKWGGISWSTFGSWAMAFDACKHLTVNDNNFGQAGPAMTGTFTYMLQFTGACDWVVAQGNNSCGLATGTIINDAMTGTNKSISGNI